MPYANLSVWTYYLYVTQYLHILGYSVFKYEELLGLFVVKQQLMT